MVFHPTQHGSTVEAGHSEVGDHAVERRTAQSINALLSASHALHFAAFFAESLLDDQSDKFFVVNGQDVHAVDGHRRGFRSFPESDG